MELYSLDNLSYTYPERDTPALDNISLSLEEGVFALLIGSTGCGKTTLARLLGGFIPHFYGGAIRGSALFRGQSLFELQPRELRREVGMVFQDPEKQVVMPEVEQDLVFGLENLGLAQNLMSRRLAEVAGFLGLEKLLQRKTNELSSGELQKVVFGSILAMAPKVLILDEPTSQLSPSASREVFDLLSRLNKDYGFTIVLVEQRLEDAFSIVERVIHLEQGSIFVDTDPESYADIAGPKSSCFMPPIARLFAGHTEKPKGFTVKEGRTLVSKIVQNQSESTGGFDQQLVQQRPLELPLLELQEIGFRYASMPAQSEALSGVNLSIFAGELISVLGENGAGKSTLLKIIAQVFAPSRGRLLFNNKETGANHWQDRVGTIGYLAQDPNLHLFNDTVEQELCCALSHLEVDKSTRINRVIEELDLEYCRFRYPRDLSAGERQRVALASVLVAEPSILILDEPTRGCDVLIKERLKKLLRSLCLSKNMAVLLVTQDVEFAAEAADRVVLVSQGKVIDNGLPCDVFHDNLFYSTQINRLFRGICEHVVNYEQAKAILKAANDY